MKKHLFFAAIAALFAAPAFAQSGTMTTKNEATGAKSTTEVKVRDNGTMKVSTTERTGRTEAGETIHDAAQDTKMAGKKVAHGTEKVADKAAHGTKVAAKKTGHVVKKAGQKVENTAEKGAEKAKDAVD